MRQHDFHTRPLTGADHPTTRSLVASMPMRRARGPVSAAWATLFLLINPAVAFADDAIVGNGSPASCTDAALDDAIFQVYFGGNQGGRIAFNCGPQPLSITLANSKILDAGVSTEIDGGGMITLDGGGQRRHLDISGDGTAVTLRGLHFTAGLAAAGTGGGALRIRNQATVVIEDCRFSSNQGGLGGGAISGANGSALTVRRSRFENNLADTGGAIDKAGLFTLTDSEFRGNSAVGDGGAVLWSSTLGEIERSRFVDNEASTGGAIMLRSGFAILREASFAANRASIFGGAVGIEQLNSGQSMRLLGVTARDNTAGQGGGGIYVRTDSFANTQITPTRLINVSTAGNRVIASTGMGGDVLAQNTSGIGFPNNVEISYSTLIGGSALSGSTLHAQRNSRITIRKSALWSAGGSVCAVSGNNPVLASGGDNIAPAGSCAVAQPSDLAISALDDLMLAALADYGGAVDTYMPLPGSPMIDYASCDPMLATTDARGSPRQVDGDGDLIGICDAGAVERRPDDASAPPAGLPFVDGFESP